MISWQQQLTLKAILETPLLCLYCTELRGLKSEWRGLLCMPLQFFAHKNQSGMAEYIHAYIYFSPRRSDCLHKNWSGMYKRPRHSDFRPRRSDFRPRLSDFRMQKIGEACTKVHADPILGHAAPILGHAAPVLGHAAPVLGHAATIFVCT